MISVTGTPRIQSNIERIIVSFMSCKKNYTLMALSIVTFVPH